jgi:hypothetical protein
MSCSSKHLEVDGIPRTCPNCDSPIKFIDVYLPILFVDDPPLDGVSHCRMQMVGLSLHTQSVVFRRRTILPTSENMCKSFKSRHLAGVAVIEGGSAAYLKNDNGVVIKRASQTERLMEIGAPIDRARRCYLAGRAMLYISARVQQVRGTTWRSHAARLSREVPRSPAR